MAVWGSLVVVWGGLGIGGGLGVLALVWGV